MQPDDSTQDEAQAEQSAKQTSVLHQVTPVSKYLAMVLFIILPFVGGYIGYSFAPEQVVEVVQPATDTGSESTTTTEFSFAEL